MPLKIAGQLVAGPKKDTLFVPRAEGDIQLHFVAVTDDSEFDKMYPEPDPPLSRKKNDGGTFETVKNWADVKYLLKIKEWEEAKDAWYFLKSIEPSQIEWETVDMAKPETFKNYKEDLKNAGFSIQERRIINGKFIEVNTITERMMTDARKRFLASQEPEPETPPA